MALCGLYDHEIICRGPVQGAHMDRLVKGNEAPAARCRKGKQIQAGYLAGPEYPGRIHQRRVEKGQGIGPEDMIASLGEAT